jgi:hypothetical protein
MTAVKYICSCVSRRFANKGLYCLRRFIGGSFYIFRIFILEAAENPVIIS